MHTYSSLRTSIQIGQLLVKSIGNMRNKWEKIVCAISHVGNFLLQESPAPYPGFPAFLHSTQLDLLTLHRCLSCWSVPRCIFTSCIEGQSRISYSMSGFTNVYWIYWSKWPIGPLIESLNKGHPNILQTLQLLQWRQPSPNGFLGRVL